jgi:t-SNARE complex subunit (syntaxin)
MESDADKSFSQSTLQQTSQKLLGSNDVAIMQREREINDIAKGIIELSDIFRDLQTMIIDQGTLLDRIDYNVERMVTDVKEADKELKVVRTGHIGQDSFIRTSTDPCCPRRLQTTNAKPQSARSSSSFF